MSFPWKESTATTDAGDAARYGAADLLKVMRWLNGRGGVDTVTVNDPLIAFSTFMRFWNPAGTFTYSVITTAIAANRNITLPLLTGNDTFVFESHTQTLANKTLTQPVINGSGGTLTLPAGPDTLVGQSTSATLTAKTLTSPTINSPTITSPTISTSVTVSDTTDIAFSTGTGTKIGTAANQKIGFYNATPIVQPAANADTSGATLGNLEIEVNQIKQLLRDLGLMAP